jgi:FMN phosphatase YigB (HAD superfamily)
VSLSSGGRTVDAVLFDLDDVIVPFHTPALWQWAWKPQGPPLNERRALAVLRRSLHAWDRRRWQGVTGRMPPTALETLREHLGATLHSIAGHPIPPAETEAVVRRVLKPAGEIERYPDVSPALRRLRDRGIRHGIVTPLPMESARWLLHRVGVPEELLLVTGDPPGPVVPDLTAFRHAVDRIDAPPGRTAFIGDLFWSDVHAAHRAGLLAFLLDRYDAWPRVVTGRMRTLEELEAIVSGGVPPTLDGATRAPGGPSPPAGEPI